MKNDKVLMGLLIIILVILNFILIYRFKNVSRQNEITLSEITKNNESRTLYLQQNLFLNYKFIDFVINQPLYTTNSNKSINELLEIDTSYIVLFYPIDICDVCEEDIFDILKLYTNKYPDKFIAIVPEINYASFKNSNIEKDLNIKHIIPYSNELLAFSSSYRRVILFTLDHELKLHNIYIPSKPLSEEEFKEYLDIVTDLNK